ncbi:MAG: prepilin-type N-terminal cleavage/methylation domain-containing protein [Candidatus Pacebacteria bacterium]|nr:prepilin-type N-terminal cleavage/methylation domain-containing protein [Candidatus Paceibacterota bacterium]
MSNKIKKIRAFTLIEILVVATIIAVLVTVTAVSFSNAQKNSRNSKRKTDLETVRQALVLYRQDKGSYGNVTGSSTAGNFTNILDRLALDGYLTSTGIADPKTGDATYVYKARCTSTPGANCNKVELSAKLETDPASNYVILTP